VTNISEDVRSMASMASSERSEVLCVGEVLWDSLPAGLFLGGAPFNVACHLRAAGVPVSLVSCVGADRLGDEATARVARYGVGTDLVQVDPQLPTGFVRVSVSDAGDASYEILAPAAWDAIQATDALLARAANARAIVFGSLAQRDPVSRRTIERLWDGTPALLVFDPNLRPPFDDARIVRRSLERAAMVKVTARELRQLARWFDLPGGTNENVPMLRTVAALAEAFHCHTVCVTRGRDGAALWRDGRWTEHPGFEVEVRDTVGTGDAFLAVLLAGLLSGADDAAALHHASLMGAYVATQTGAVPSDQPAPFAPPRRQGSAAAEPAAEAPRRRSRARGRRPAE
jgi:fructokinase